MLSMRSSRTCKVNSIKENEIVILFFGVLLNLIKNQDNDRANNWKVKGFENAVHGMVEKKDPAAMKMIEELALCRRRRRLRRYYYNVSNIDSVYNEYFISRSDITLSNAWRLFNTGGYLM